MGSIRKIKHLKNKKRYLTRFRQSKIGNKKNSTRLFNNAKTERSLMCEQLY